MTMKNKILLQPLNMKGLYLKNRIVMAPLTRNRSDNKEHAATELNATYYSQRASAGLIVTEGTVISPEAVGYINVPGIYSESQVEGWKLVTDAVHEKGGLIFAQLWHVGRVSHPDLLKGELPLAPSALNPFTQAYTDKGFADTVVAKEMTINDIKRTVQDYKKAAINAVNAGFDGVEIHAANGYLLQQFFNKYSNHRSDEYGGSIEKRAKIIFDILDELQEIPNLDHVGIRFNPSLHNDLGMMLDNESIKVHEYIIKKLNHYKVAYIHLVEPKIKLYDIPYMVNEVAKHFRPLFNGVLITNREYTFETGNKIIEEENADLVSFGVPFISNPDLVERFENSFPLSESDHNTFYTPGSHGYTDYPSYSDQINKG
jgi:N-ethylmaleimide reductase